MNRYLAYSGSLHAGLFLLLAMMMGRAAPKVYRIDFIGGAVLDTGRGAPAAAPPTRAAPAKPSAPKAKPGEEMTRNEIALPRKGAPLPRPSVLGAPGSESAPTPAPAGQASASTTPGGDAPGISTEFPNFPYPWYISRVRQALWAAWSARMPESGHLSATVFFEIGRGGEIASASVETGSGNRAFDLGAMSSVNDAAPFPPLPREYKDATLRVHVEFRTLQ